MPYEFNACKILFLANALKIFDGESMLLYKGETLNLLLNIKNAFGKVLSQRLGEYCCIHWKRVDIYKIKGRNQLIRDFCYLT